MTKINKDQTDTLGRIKKSREIATTLFGPNPSRETINGVYVRVFLLTEDVDAAMENIPRAVKPGKLSPNQQQVLEDILASKDKVADTYGALPTADEEAQAAFDIFDFLFSADYEVEEDDDDDEAGEDDDEAAE